MSTAPEPTIPVPSREEVQGRLAEIRALSANSHTEPALLLAWGTMEGVARAVAGERFAQPQTPGRIVETLAMEGYITPSEADRVRGLIAKRNRLIHGELGIRASAVEIEDFVRTIEQLEKMRRQRSGRTARQQQ